MQNKGVIFDINKYAVNDGPGIRTTIFLKGCPLNCQWCHNPESRDSRIEYTLSERHKKLFNLPSSETKNLIGKVVSVDDVMKEILKDILFYEESGGGVTFSGGEPMMQPDFLISLLKKCKSNEIHTAVDTSGYAGTDSFRKVAEFTDLFLFDLKLMENKNHIKYIGAPNRLILQNINFLNDIGKDIRIRIPLVPGITDTDDNLNRIIALISNLKNISCVDLLPFNELIDGKYSRLDKNLELKNLKTQSEETLNKLVEKFRVPGFNVTLKG